MTSPYRARGASAWMLAVILCGCTPSRTIPHDTLFLHMDADFPSCDFRGGGSLFPGGGWAQPAGDGLTPDWGNMAWAVGREADLIVPTRKGERVDLVVRALPFPWAAGSPVQKMEVLTGGKPAARVELPQRWEDLRIALPEDFATGRLERLVLRFDHALRPRDIGQGNDTRLLAAAFSRMAVVPHGVRDPWPLLEVSKLDARGRRARIPAGGSVAMPLPAASRIQLQMGEARGCSACTLTVEMVGRNGETAPLWNGPTDVAADRTLRFETGPSDRPLLYLRVRSDAPGAVELPLDGWAVRASPRARPSGRPNVFIYLIDTLRADSLTSQDGAAAPNMNALARDAVRYDRARAAATWTLPSVVSLLTGRYVDYHSRLRDYGGKETLLQSRLGALGYQTAGFSHSMIVSDIYGLSAGFESFFYSDHLNGERLRSGDAVRLLAEWLRQADPAQPVFAYVHTVDPHAPYSPPDGVDVLGQGPHLPLADYSPVVFQAKGYDRDPRNVDQMRRLYEAEVRHADAELGRFLSLLKWLDLYDESVVIVTGDHGEEFAEHRGFDHGRTLYDELLRVPLFIKFPHRRWAGTRVLDDVSLVDVAATVLAQAGGPALPLDGTALAPRPGERPLGRGVVHFETAPLRGSGAGSAPVDLRGAARGSLKCIENKTGTDRWEQPAPPLMAFDLAADPEERHPLPMTPTLAARCREMLDARPAGDASSRMPPPLALEKLRALGYVE